MEKNQQTTMRKNEENTFLPAKTVKTSQDIMADIQRILFKGRILSPVFSPQFSDISTELGWCLLPLKDHPQQDMQMHL